MIIAIDGPTASGKGTLAKRIAGAMGLRRLDTGALYRAVGLAVLDAGLDPGDEGAALHAAKALDLARLDAVIDENRIRTAAVGRAASIVAAMPAVRDALLEAQRAFARAPGGAVLDGRDIGTVICPEAEVKLFVTASLDARAARRHAELTARGESLTLEELRAQIAERDERDQSRLIAPLRPADGAMLLDTTELSIDEAVASALGLIEHGLERPHS